MAAAQDQDDNTDDPLGEVYQEMQLLKRHKAATEEDKRRGPPADPGPGDNPDLQLYGIKLSHDATIFALYAPKLLLLVTTL